MTQKELTKLCKTWQKMLRLSDWQVDIKFVKQYEFGAGSTCEGTCQWNLFAKRALIKVLTPEDYDEENSSVPQDISNTVAHELLHLHFAQVTGEKVSNEVETALEQAIEAITGALVGLSRVGE